MEFLPWRELVKIKTTRFGDLDVDKKDIIKFPEGILGFETAKEFFIVDPGDRTLILWLQSANEGSTAFPIIEPRIFMPEYSLGNLPPDTNEPTDDIGIYAILTIPQDATKMSANLKAPIIINNKSKTGKQTILQDSKFEVRHAMYKKLKSLLVSRPSDDSVRTNIHVAPAIKKDETTEEGTVPPPKADTTPQKI